MTSAITGGSGDYICRVKWGLRLRYRPVARLDGKASYLEGDILCEGHFGIFQPGDRVEAYIQKYLRQYG